MSRILRSLEAANFSGMYVVLYDTTSGHLRPFPMELLLTLRPKLPALLPEPSLQLHLQWWVLLLLGRLLFDLYHFTEQAFYIVNSCLL